MWIPYHEDTLGISRGHHGNIKGISGGDIMEISWGNYLGDGKLSWGYQGYSIGILLAYHADIGSLEKSDVLPLEVKLKLRHWPSTAYSFIYRLTNKKPAFHHLQY